MMNLICKNYQIGFFLDISLINIKRGLDKMNNNVKQDHTTVSTSGVNKNSTSSKKEEYEAAGIPVDRLVVCNGLPISVD